MPYYKIALTRGAHPSPERILEAVRRGNAAAGYPADDVFQRLDELPASHLVIDARYPDLPRDRTARLVVVEVVTAAETPSERRDRIRSGLVGSLAEIGLDPNDLIVFFVEYDRATSSFGGGTTPPPIQLTD